MNKILLYFYTAILLCSCSDRDNANEQNRINSKTTEEEKLNMSQINEVSAKHILVETEEAANDLLKKINNGEISFENAAKEYSKCPSKRNGGDLGFFGRGMMVKEFEDAAFALKEGEVSAPVQTQFGWHLIKIEKTR